jgi:hypothetical protein
MRNLITFVLCFFLFEVQFLAPFQFVQKSSTNNIAYAADEAGSTTKSFDPESPEEISIMNIIMLVAIGFVAKTIMISCVGFPLDVIVAAAAAAAYIAGEVMAIISYNDLTYESIDYEEGDLTQDQVKTFEDQKKMYEDVVETAETKLILQQAAAAGFAGAAAIALFKGNKHDGTRAGCEAALLAEPSQTCQLEKGKAILQSIDAVKNNPGESKKKTASLKKALNELKAITPKCPLAANNCTTFILGFDADLTSCNKGSLGDVLNGKGAGVMCPQKNPIREAIPYFSEEKISIFAKVGYRPLKKEVLINKYDENSNAQWEEYIRFHEMNDYYTGGIVSMTLDDYKMFEDNFVPQNKFQIEAFSRVIQLAMEEGVNLILPAAQAKDDKDKKEKGSFLDGLGPYLGLGGGLLAFFFAEKLFFGKQIDMMISVPTTRAIIWGVFAAMAFAATGSTQDMIDLMKRNIEEINGILEQFSRVQKAAQIAASGGNTGGSISSIPINQQQKIFDNAEKRIIAVDGKRFSCIIKAGSRQCQSLEKTAQKVGLNGIGNELGGFAQNVARLGDSLQGNSNLSGSALANAQNIGNQSAFLNRARRKLEDQFNKNRAKNGKKPFNFRNAEGNLLKNFRAATASRLKSAGLTPGDVLNSLNTNGPKLDSLNLGKEKKSKKTTKSVKAGGVGKASGSDFRLDFTGDSTLEGLDDSPNSPQPIAATGDEVESIDNFEINEINGPNIDLWEAISKRYMLSAFPRIFEEIPSKQSE